MAALAFLVIIISLALSSRHKVVLLIASGALFTGVGCICLMVFLIRLYDRFPNPGRYLIG